MSKYVPLQQHLAAQPATVTDVTLSFGKVEEILGFTLPPSAYKYRE